MRVRSRALQSIRFVARARLREAAVWRARTLGFVMLGLLTALRPALGTEAPAERPKIGVAFSGGGARGGAHIGVLRVLEELRIPVDFVAGTSIGAIVGALYATGMSPDEMEEVLTATDWDDALRDDVRRAQRPYRAKEDDRLYLIDFELGFDKGRLVLPGGLVAGQKLGFMLRRLTLPARETTDFDHLPVPFRAVATDIVTGDKVVLQRGDIARAVRASMAIPGIFSPVDLDGRLLVDGASTDNLPIDVVREMGAEVVIAIDISNPLIPREKLNNLFAITTQTGGFLTRLNMLEQISTLTGHDVLITPDLEGIGTLSFAEFPRAVGQGEEAARGVVDALSRLSVSEEEYAEFLKMQRVPRTEPRIDEVRVEPVPGIDSRVFRGRIASKPGELDWQTVASDLARLYELGTFETVDFHVVREGGREVLVFGGWPPPPAPDRLRFGLFTETDDSKESSFDLRLGLYMTRLNSRLAELRTRIEVGEANSLGVEFYQPVDFRGTFFVSPTVSVRREPQGVYLGDNEIARIIETRYSGRLDAGVSLGALGEVRLGVLRERYTLRTDIFTSTEPLSVTEDVAGVNLRAIFDQLDSVSFPRSGWLAGTDLMVARRAAGGGVEYARVRARGLVAKTFGETSIVPSVELDSRIGGPARPAFDQAILGGFLRLSGLKPYQLRGQYGGLAKVVVFHRILKLNSLVGTGVYVGGSIETGNTWRDSMSLSDLRTAGSLFVGADTIVGPLQVAYGRASGGNSSFYLVLGFPIG